MRHQPRSQTAEGPPRPLHPRFLFRVSLAHSPPGKSIMINRDNGLHQFSHAIVSVSAIHSRPISATITTILTFPLLPEMGTLRRWRDRGSGGDGCKSRSRTTTTSAWSAAAGCPSTGCPVSGVDISIKVSHTRPEACITTPCPSTCQDTLPPDCPDRPSKQLGVGL